MTHIISEICDYAKKNNNMNPNETLKTVANNIMAICEIVTFNNWEKSEENE